LRDLRGCEGQEPEEKGRMHLRQRFDGVWALE
jgi:hypothetical protein